MMAMSNSARRWQTFTKNDPVEKTPPEGTLDDEEMEELLMELVESDLLNAQDLRGYRADLKRTTIHRLKKMKAEYDRKKKAENALENKNKNAWISMVWLMYRIQLLEML